MRREVNINIPHRHHLAGILEATLYLYIGKRSIPREIDLASHERLNQGIVVRVEHPVELDAMPKKMRLESSEYTDVSRRRRSTKPHHNDLLLLLHTADPAHGRIKHLPTEDRMDRSIGMSILQRLMCGQTGPRTAFSDPR
jgi:hypothetical protein